MVHQRILEAAARPTIGHLDPSFVVLMDEIKKLLQYVFQTENYMTMPVSAPGSAGMEMCFTNLVEPGDKVVVCINGVFGGRMKENVERCGGIAIVVEDEWGSPVSLEKVEQALKNNPGTRVTAFVHAETSTGVLSDAEALTRISHEHGSLVIVDAVTSLGGVPLKVDEWKLDAVYSGSQKCLSCFPGLSPVTFSDAALDRVKSRKTKVQSWFLDINLVMGYWGSGGGRSYHHTAPVNTLYALHEALLMVHEEGLENAWERHKRNHLLLVQGLDELGMELLVEAPYRLPQLNAVIIPDGIDDTAARKYFLDNHGLEIGAGLGVLAGKIWRIGLMGQASRADYVRRCLDILREVVT
jgi:alanine-glyoxylate transaminase/serine-glyoxylate transaminase/serine-pyruvate transaminase